MPVLSYSNKLLTLAQQIGTPDKEKLRAFIRGLDNTIKYAIRNLNPKTYEEALALAQNKELELNGGKPKQAAGGSTNSQGGGKSHADKTTQEQGKNGKAAGQPKQTPDEKATAGVQGGFLSEEERKAYMSEQRCFFCHTKGHRKQDCPKWKAKNATSQASSSISAVTPASQAPTTDTPQQ